MAELTDTTKLSPWAQLLEIYLSSARVKETTVEQNCDVQTAGNHSSSPASAKGYAQVLE